MSRFAEAGALPGARAGWRDSAVFAWAAVTVGFHLWLVFSGLVPNLVSRPLHLAVSLPWIFVIGAAGGRLTRISGYAACTVGIACCAYIAFDRSALADQYGAIAGWPQYALALLLIAVVLEAARRAIQPVLPAVAGLVLLYGLFGEHLPASIGHAGIPLDYFLGNLVIAEGGLWGSLTGISVDLIVPFLILGGFVSAGDAGTGFMSLATQLAGRYRAGAAKVGVLASALYGTISGSASANVASTGTVTIPAMKRMGYPAKFAAAVEAVASSGGQVMPPVMGAGVFLMAELLQTGYTDLMVASVLPALLFFFAAWAGIHHFARRADLRGMDPGDMPGWRKVARTAPFFAAPLLTLVALLAADYSAAYAAVVATAVTAALNLFSAEGRPGLGLWWRRSLTAMVEASKQIAMIAAIIICAGVITGVFNATGLGVKITSLIIGLSAGKLWVALLLTAAACIVLGMELPTTAAYLICISVAGPALVKLGLPELHAHMFVFWYALLCTITPPVCGNVFIAASIAGTHWLPVAWLSMRLGVGLFLVPLAFIADPALLLVASEPWAALLAAAKIGVGLWLVSYMLIGGAWTLRGLLAGAAGALLLFGIGGGG